MIRRVVIGVALAVVVPVSAWAQDPSHWGMSVTLTPNWSVPARVGDALGGTIDLQGSDVNVGFVHGREFGGDWGVNFVRKNVKDGSTANDLSQDCSFANGCVQSGESITYTDTRLTGIEVSKYVNFATISRRVQIGMTFAGGIASVSGTQVKREFSADFVGVAPGGAPVGRQTQTVTVAPADFGVSPFPLVKIQLAVGVLATHGVKLRVAGGLDTPGVSIFSITGVYLFGAR
ncbi:MAG TPA: hypothetical protein VNG89_05285 [Vicinamibacterales bacterium]|nr:hypothetical protein [Vicinamibacterales bacterium]